MIWLAGLPVIWWAAILIADAIQPGRNLFELMEVLTEKMNHPFQLHYTEYTIKSMLVCTLLYAAGIGIFYSSQKNYRRGEEHGSARWGDARQICKKYSQKPYSQNILLTQNFRISLDTHKHRRCLNILVVGGSGAGKSRGFALPNIMQCCCSMVITDPKAELLRKTGGLLEKKGYEVRVFDLINPDTSFCYNPFEYVHDDKDVLRLISNLIQNTTPKGSQSSDPFWEKSETALLQALMLYLLHEAPPEEQNFAMIMEMLGSAQVKEEDEDYESPLDILFDRLEMRDPDSIAVKQYHIYKQAAGKTAKSILISVGVRLAAFNLPQIAKLTNTDELDLSSMGERKVALFCCIPDADTSLNYLVGMIYSQLFQTLYYMADRVHGGALPVPVNCIMDETICNDPQVCRIVDLPVYYELETNNGNRDYRIQIGGHYMNYNTVYVGMDVHKESFTLCSCKYEDEKASHYQRTPASYKNVLRYLAFLRTIYGEDTRFVCGYEAGCLGYSLYHQLENFNVECVILAPTTMLEQRSKRRIKTDKRDAEIIARSLAQHNYSPVHIPTETDNQTKEFIRMRDDHKAELKKIKQQILSFCLRQGYQYDGSGNWTAKHVKWLRSLKPAGLYKEILDEYLLTYTILTDKLNRLDQRIEELASKEEYKESVSKLTCFLGIKTHTALSVIVEVGDFQRFVSARKFAGYLGLVPGQHSSGDDRNGLGITKAGNTHVRRLLVESAQSYTRGKIGYKSRVLRSRQAGNSPQVINYADRANERLRRRYYKMVLKDGKKYNIAKTAIARELACFIWGMMTDNIY